MVVLERKLRGDPLRKGQWYLNQNAQVSVVCPGCGGVGNLDDHEITLIGTGTALVNPSLQCACGFHDSVALKDWELRDEVA